MKIDTKTIYAQSSDIKARTFLEYRRDMKKKAIAELETLDWLESKLESMNPGKSVRVEKSGGDSFLWFLRKGGVSRDADFLATVDDVRTDYEFQLADNATLPYYDFKISKVAVKKKGKRVPVENTKFVYLHKPLKKFAFVEPKWIMENGQIDSVPAWGSRLAYRVPSCEFEPLLQPDSTLEPLINRIDQKIAILEYQHGFYSHSRRRMSTLIQGFTDKNENFALRSHDADSFFIACLLLDAIGEYPAQGEAWLHEAIGLARLESSFERLAGLVYCVDYLYTKRDPLDDDTRLAESELAELTDFASEVLKVIKDSAGKDGAYADSVAGDESISTRSALFILNLLEDMTQDMIHYYGVSRLKPVRKIFENVKDVEATFNFVGTHSE